MNPAPFLNAAAILRANSSDYQHQPPQRQYSSMSTFLLTATAAMASVIISSPARAIATLVRRVAFDIAGTFRRAHRSQASAEHAYVETLFRMKNRELQKLLPIGEKEHLTRAGEEGREHRPPLAMHVAAPLVRHLWRRRAGIFPTR